MKTILVTRQQSRAYKQSSLARITPGQIKGLCNRGYGWTIRQVRVDSRKAEWTIPSNAAREMKIAAGDLIVTCRTADRHVLDIARMSALDQRDVDGQPILGEVISTGKVRWDTDGVEMTITKEVQAVLGDVTGKLVVLNTTRYPEVVTQRIIEPSQVLEELAKMQTEGLWGWPVLIEDSTQAWVEGYEPFGQAMAETELPPKYPRRDPRNLARVAAVNKIMTDTADSQAELRRTDEWI